MPGAIRELLSSDPSAAAHAARAATLPFLDPADFMARFPDFLVIGAMKAGTTSLFFDLSANSSIFFPEDKEPHDLATDRVLTEEGMAAYARLYRKAGPLQICGDASTGYSKLPDIVGVPDRAVRTCGEKLRAVYLVRDPVLRVISQHHHELAGGDVPADIDAAVREVPRLIDYSRYAYQAEPWIDALGRHNVRIVRFESYVTDRVSLLREISAFLGVEPKTEGVDPDRVYNSGRGLWARRGALWHLSRGRLYRALVRPLLPRRFRSRLRDSLLPRAPERPRPPSIDTVDHILDRVHDDVRRLQSLAGWAEAPWDLDATRRRFLSSEGGEAPHGPAAAGQ